MSAEKKVSTAFNQEPEVGVKWEMKRGGGGTLRIEAFDITLDLGELYAGVLPTGGAQAQGETGR